MRVLGLEVHVAANAVDSGTATYTRRPAMAQVAYADTRIEAPEPVAQSLTHKVQTGENLTRIVHDHLSANGMRPSANDVYAGVLDVARENRLANPDLIHPGQVLDLSVLTQDTPAPAVSSEPDRSADVRTPGVPEARTVAGTPLPRRLLDSAALLAPPGGEPGTVTGATAPVDHLLGDEAVQPEGMPVRIAASSVAALMTPPAESPSGAPGRSEASGAAGGAGPVPSEAAIALQRLLNRTSNALHVLRGIVDRDVAETPAAENPWVSLVDGKARLSSEFGTRRDPFTGRTEFHDGIDLAVKRGTGITAVRGGEVVFSGWKGGYGNTVILRHDGGVETLYAHAAELHVQAGDRVEAGMPIADAGSSGRSTGPHVHFEVREHGRAVNPMPYLDSAETVVARGSS